MEQRIGYMFKLINDKLKVSADEDLKKHGITLSQSHVLAFLTSRGNQATQKEIEDFLEVSHPTVVGLVSRMEKKGFLVTWTYKADKRNKIVSLTDKAISVSEDMRSVVEAKDKALLNSLTQQQIEDLINTLNIIYKNLE